MRMKNANRSPKVVDSSTGVGGSFKRKLISKSRKSLNGSPSKRSNAQDVKQVENSKVTTKRRKLGEEHFEFSDITEEDMSDVVIASQSSAPSMTYFINLLSPKQKANVEEIGFGGLLKINLAKDLNRSLYEYLVLNYNPIAKILVVGDNKISFNSVDLHNVLGIPHTSTPVIELSKMKSDQNPDKHVIQEWRDYFGLDNVANEANVEVGEIKEVKKKFSFATKSTTSKNEKAIESDNFKVLKCVPLKTPLLKNSELDVEKRNNSDKAMVKKKYVPLQFWENKFLELKDGGDEFKRVFVLFAISNFLSPYADKSINLSTVKSLADVKKIKDYDWCGYIVKNMCNSINELQKYLIEKKKKSVASASNGQKPTKYVKKIGGCLPALLVAFVQKVHFGEHVGVELPFISNWNSDTLNARIKAQSEDRSQFGAGIVKQDVVVSSNVFVEKKLVEVVERKNDIRTSSENDLGLYLQYKIPKDLPTDKEIHSMNISDVEKKLMILHRNIKITSSINLGLIKEIKEDGEKLSQQSSQPESNFDVNDELFEMLNSFTENFTQQKEIVDKKKGFPIMFDKKKESDIYYIEDPPIYSKNEEIRNDEVIPAICNDNKDNMIFEKSNDEKISNEEVISDVANKRNDDLNPNDGIGTVSSSTMKDTSNT